MPDVGIVTTDEQKHTAPEIDGLCAFLCFYKYSALTTGPS